MALPVPVIVNDHSLSERSKFTASGDNFAQFVATWPTALPLNPPDTADSGATTDPWRQGDNVAVTRILYRVIENRSTPASTTLPDAVLTAIVSDTTVRTAEWQRQGTTDFYYRDLVLAVSPEQRAAGKHIALLPTAAWVTSMVNDIDATSKCYWVMAWLGTDDLDILLGYEVV